MSGMDAKQSLMSNDELQQQQNYGGAVPPSYTAGQQPYSQPAPVFQQPSGGYYQERNQTQQQHMISQTTVQHQQPVAFQPQRTYNVVNTTTVITSQPGRQWRAGLCDCCNDCAVCLCVCFCGQCYACALARRLDEHCCVGMSLAGNTALRTKFRMIHHIEGSLCDDVCVNMFCGSCSLCQLGREMNAEQYPKVCCGNC